MPRTSTKPAEQPARHFSKRKRVFDSNDHDAGQEVTRTVKSTGPASEAIETPAIEKVEGPLNMKKMDELKFMQDMLLVEITTSDDPNADPVPMVTVDTGVKVIRAAFFRGQPKWVPRCIVERLARMKKTGFGNKKVIDEETGVESYVHPETNTFALPFVVHEDPAGQKGRDWLMKIKSERQ